MNEIGVGRFGSIVDALFSYSILNLYEKVNTVVVSYWLK